MKYDMDKANRLAKRLSVVGKMFLAAATGVLMIAFITAEPESTHPTAAYGEIAHWVGIFVAGFCVCAFLSPMLRTWAAQQAKWDD